MISCLHFGQQNPFKMGSTFKGKNCSKGSKFFSVLVDPHKDNYENGQS